MGRAGWKYVRPPVPTGETGNVRNRVVRVKAYNLQTAGDQHRNESLRRAYEASFESQKRGPRESGTGRLLSSKRARG